MLLASSVRQVRILWVLAAGIGCATSAAQAGAPTLTSSSPAARAANVPIATPVVINFDQPMLTSSINDQTVYVFGRWSGRALGTITFSNGNQTATLTPTRPFSAGEQVMVALSKNIKAADNTPIRPSGYSWQFWTRTRPAAMTYTEVDTFSNRTGGPGGPQTRIYGASGTDYNEDGYLDLATVNEVSQDVRVFLNSADGLGNYDQPALPPEPIGNEASPNEPADFNLDGHADLASAAASSSDVWIILGAGDGTFFSSQDVSVGSSPHGIAILDVNGDAAMDIATANTGGGNVSVLINNGDGTFAAAVNFDGSPSNDEYALGAADFNNDNILDLVVGDISAQQVIIHRNNGNGTFTQLGSASAGGNVWMLTVGDVNGDGNMDVATANSFSNNGGILLGDGAGGLAAAITVPMSGHTVATDLGDLDGDGDLDWELSSFGAGNWELFKNNGSATFTFNQEFTALNNPSCAVMLDIDNDRDLDLALTDEIADMVTVMKNSGSAPLGDYNNDGQINGTDFTAFSACFSGDGIDAGIACGHGDFNGDGDCDCNDLLLFQDVWTGGGTPPGLPQCAGIPAVSTWTMIIMLLLIASVGTVIARRSTPSVA